MLRLAQFVGVYSYAETLQSNCSPRDAFQETVIPKTTHSSSINPKETLDQFSQLSSTIAADKLVLSTTKECHRFHADLIIVPSFPVGVGAVPRQLHGEVDTA